MAKTGRFGSLTPLTEAQHPPASVQPASCLVAHENYREVSPLSYPAQDLVRMNELEFIFLKQGGLSGH